MQAGGLALAIADLRLAIARQVAQLADRLGWDQARTQQAGFGQPADPLSVTDIGLATRDLLDVPGVDRQARKAVLEDRPDRLSVDTSCFHRDLGDGMGGQPVGQREQPRHGPGERLDVLLAFAMLAGG